LSGPFRSDDRLASAAPGLRFCTATGPCLLLAAFFLASRPGQGPEPWVGDRASASGCPPPGLLTIESDSPEGLTNVTGVITRSAMLRISLFPISAPGGHLRQAQYFTNGASLRAEAAMWMWCRKAENLLRAERVIFYMVDSEAEWLASQQLSNRCFSQTAPPGDPGPAAAPFPCRDELPRSKTWALSLGGRPLGQSV